MKFDPRAPRVHRAGYGWPVDLARDKQSNCVCGAPIYWVVIQPKQGPPKPMPLSEAMAKRDEQGNVYMAGHHADCPRAQEFGGKRRT